MQKKNRRKIKAIKKKKCFVPLGKPLGIFKDIYENALCQVAEFKRNPKLCVKVLRVKIVDLDKFSKIGFCWCDSNGMIQNSEPFKVGDVGYINLVEDEGESFSPVTLELFAECVGIELLEGPRVDIEIKVDLQKSSF